MSFQFDPIAKAFLSVFAANVVIQPIVFAIVPHSHPVVAAIVAILDVFVVIFSFGALVGGIVEEQTQNRRRADKEKYQRDQARQARELQRVNDTYARDAAWSAAIDARLHEEARRKEIARLQAELSAVRLKRMGDL